jgi:hypothetical protein
MIYKCTCVNEYQDKLYGKGKRVFNPMGMNGKSGIRCATCGKEDSTVIAKQEKKSDSSK